MKQLVSHRQLLNRALVPLFQLAFAAEVGRSNLMSTEPNPVQATPVSHQSGPNDYYRSLDATGIIRAVTLLHKRICRKFPESGLSKVAAELLKVSQEAADRAAATERPHIPLRLGTGAILLLAAGCMVWMLIGMRLSASVTTVLDLLQGLESSINVLLLTFAGVWSLVSLETRIKRTAALRMLHELRVLAHLVDMHQLTKDPKCLFTDDIEIPHPGSPLTTPQLVQYLDYCNDMLSLTGKIAALYAQYFDDRVVLQAIDEVENLTTSLSRKIWQKIMILHEISVSDAVESSDAAAS